MSQVALGYRLISFLLPEWQLVAPQFHALQLRIEIGHRIEAVVNVSELGGIRRDSRAADLLDFFHRQLTGANASKDSCILICHIDSCSFWVLAK
jgi:hypothetical protein